VRSHAKASTAGSTQRQVRRLVLPFAVLAALVSLMVAAFPASAITTHPFKEVLGSVAQPSFGSAQGIAVDQPSGDVLVMDAGTSTIQRFNPDGTPANFAALGTNVIDGQGTGDETPQGSLSFASPGESQIAVDNSGTATDGNIYVTESSPNVINVFSDEGEYLGNLSNSGLGGIAFQEACGVAVDPSGALYVGDYERGIHKYVPAANPPVNDDYTATFTSVGEPCTLAAGAGPSAGFLFAAQFNGPVSKLDSSSGELKYTVSEGVNRTLFVDPTSGNVLTASGVSIKEFDASGPSSATSVSSIALASGARGVAARGSSGDIYVSRGGFANLEVFGPLAVVPEVTTNPASNVAVTSATLNGTVNPDGVQLSECKFEYGKTTGYGQSAPCAQSPAAIGSGTSPVPVSADISGLDLGAEYHFRLVAKNPNGSVSGANKDFKLTSPPAIEAQWVEGVTFHEAILKAEINLGDGATSYHFEYGTADCVSNPCTATPSAGAGTGSGTVKVSKEIEGLTSDTTYHFRVVATNVAGTAEGPDLTFTTYALPAAQTDCPNQALRLGASAGLPDCRAYEMVSPVEKNGGDIVLADNISHPGAGYNKATPSGEKLAYSSSASFGDQLSSLNSNHYIATRSATGWSSDGINAPVSLGSIFPVVSPFALQPSVLGFTEDLSSAWMTNEGKTTLTADAVPGFVNMYRRDNLTGSFEAVTVNTPTRYFKEADAVKEGLGLGLQFKGASADGKVTAYNANAALTPESGTSILAQPYVFSDGELRLISILPDGTPATEDASVGAANHVNAGENSWGYQDTVARAVSEDGSRIFWTIGIGESQGMVGKLYLRQNPTEEQSALDGSGECTEAAKACTIAVSESVNTRRARFYTASPDGSKVLFSIGTSDSGETALYEYDVETETPTLIAAEPKGVLGASEDLSYVYYISEEALDAGATAGERNLYLHHGGAETFIATLSAHDLAEEIETGLGDTSAVAGVPLYHNSRVTPDGRHLAFVSDRSLTGYDNTDAANSEALREVFFYDADSEDPLCISCRPSGESPLGMVLPRPYQAQGEIPGSVWHAAWVPTWERELQASRVISDDGSRVFFESFDALLPEDTNGKVDVYQWEEQDAGSCERAGGCLSLLSTGKSSRNSDFVDASADGQDVFIRTLSSLVPQDPGSVDIYDVRAGGGYPLPVKAGCLGDACQAVPEAPRDPTPASASFKGAGDPAAKKPRRRCTSRKRHAGKAKGNEAKAKQKAKRCKRAKRGAGR
jgi:hypothetical protein